MEIDLDGFVKQNPLPQSAHLLPLFEAIVNSIQAIEDRQDKENLSKEDGFIEVSIQRELSRQGELSISKKEERQSKPTGFSVKDNGIGFNKGNFGSFGKTHSQKKSKSGGKGIGRISWLKAFEEAKIESVFKDGDVRKERSFVFSIEVKGVGDHSEKESTKEPSTTVELVGYKEPYRGECPSGADIIAERILDHLLLYFLLEKAPQIKVVDGDGKISLNELYGKHIKDKELIQFEIGEHDFELRHARSFLSVSQGNVHNSRLIWCASGREVIKKNINSFLGIKETLCDGSGNNFHSVSCLTGSYLDDKVNQERTDFGIPKKPKGTKKTLDVGEIYEEELMDESLKRIREVLAEPLKAIAKEREARVEAVLHEYPQYKRYVEETEECCQGLPSEEKIIKALGEMKTKDRIKTREEMKKLRKKIDVSTPEEFKKTAEAIQKKIADDGIKALSDYIVHRKNVIEWLKKILECDSDSNYRKEEAIHNLIMPMRTSNEGMPDISALGNLWLVDERLACSSYLASDKAIDKGNRPDILALESFSMGEKSEGGHYGNVILLEFKRPGELTSDPVSQVDKYMDLVGEGTAKTEKGRPINILENGMFYTYMLVDTFKGWERTFKSGQFHKLPHDRGYCRYQINYRAWQEVITYDRLISDASERNRILFEKLGLS